MSRIGKKLIDIPGGVTYQFDKASGIVTVKGPKGELKQDIDSSFDIVEEEDNKLKIIRPSEQKKHKALHGLYRSLINNMIVGVHEGYKKVLELNGVGFKADVQGNTLELNIGYSHSIFMAVPSEIKIGAEMAKGKNPTVTLEGIDKQLIGQVAAKIKSLRKVEPYKGKGIYLVGDTILRKAGKQVAK